MKKVLVIDDTKNIRTLLTKCLEIEGYEVETASDGNQALDLFTKKQFDLAFLDIKMPFVSGTEVLKNIRDRNIHTPVIIITAYASVKNAVECTQMGAVAYLQKPFTPEKVRTVLKELETTKCIGRVCEETLYERAETLIDEKRYAEALNILKAGLSEQSLNENIYMLLSKACEGMGKKDDAQNYLNIYTTLSKTLIK